MTNEMPKPDGNSDAARFWAVTDGTTAIERYAAEKAAEVERLREALTPSAETKAAYIGEFSWNEESDSGVGFSDHVVPWTVIKQIMAAISERAVTTPGDHQ